MSKRHPLYDRPIGVFAVLAAVVVLGGLLVPRLAVDIWPSFRTQTLFLRAQIEDSTARETLESLTRPLEGLIRGIDGVESISSRTRDRNATLFISPHPDSDQRELLAAISDSLAANRHRFPSEMTYRVGSWSNEDAPPIAFAVGAGDRHPAAFEELIEGTLIPALSSIDGVAAATQGDYDPGQVQVLVEPQRAQAAGLNGQDLAQQLSALEPQSLAYRSQQGSRSVDTVLHLRLDQGSPTELESLSVAPNTALNQVAVVYRSPPGGDRVVLVNGKPGAVISVYRSPEANGYRVSRDAEALMQDLAAHHNLNLIVPTATHRTINAAGSELLGSALWGGLSAFIFLILFLQRLRLTILVCLAIPGSLALAVIGLAWGNNAVNIFTMVGFLLALGMLVDNSVVVAEALSRSPLSKDLSQQRRLRHRAVGGVSMAIVLSTLTTIAIVLPFQLLDTGPISGPVNALAKPLIWSLLGSLCVALILTPILFEWWYRRGQQRPTRRPWWLRQLERLYGRAMFLVIRQPIVGTVMLLTILAIPLVLMLQHPAGMSLNAQLETDERRAVLPIVQRTSVPLSRFQEVASRWHQQLEPHLSELGATGVVAEIGGRRSEMHIYLSPLDDGLDSDTVANRVADILSPELDLALQAHIDRAQGEAASSGSQRRWRSRSGNDSRLHFVLRHPHAEAMAPIWATLRPVILDIPGVRWASAPFEPPEPALEFAILPQALAAGFRPQNVGWQINRLTSQRTVASLADGTSITMGPLRRQNPTLGEIEGMTINAAGVSQRLGGLASLGTVSGSETIRRRDGMSEESIMVSIDSEARARVMRTILDAGFPAAAGVDEATQINLTWWLQRGEDSKGSMLLAIALAGGVVFLIMAFFYESLIAPFAALASVPLALISVIAWIGWSGQETGAMALIGCFFLVGIVVNNGIVLVDHLRRTVPPPRCSNQRRVAAALAGAARRRLSPILLTSLTTICAALPMALGSSSIAGLPVSELGSTIAAGLIGATLCTLLVVPLTYYWLARLRASFSGR